MKYQPGYREPSRYPFDDEEQSLAQKSPRRLLKSAAPVDFPNVATKADVRGEGSEPGSQAGTSFEHHVSDACV